MTIWKAIVCAGLAAALLAPVASAGKRKDTLLPDLTLDAFGTPFVVTPTEAPPPADAAAGATADQPPADTANHTYLAFGANVVNVGDGPLVIRGQRASTDEPSMTADQVVMRPDGGETVVSGAGSVQFDPERSYDRWGFANFLRYELRDSKTKKIVATAPEGNWCISDFRQVRLKPPLKHTPNDRVFDNGCLRGEDTALSVDMGLSIGWDNYHSPRKKGQSIDITDVPAGTYVLVERVNPAGTLKEISTKNNASSVLLELRKGSGGTTAHILRRCPGSGKCRPPKPKKHHRSHGK